MSATAAHRVLPIERCFLTNDDPRISPDRARNKCQSVSGNLGGQVKRKRPGLRVQHFRPQAASRSPPRKLSQFQPQLRQSGRILLAPVAAGRAGNSLQS